LLKDSPGQQLSSPKSISRGSSATFFHLPHIELCSHSSHNIQSRSPLRRPFPHLSAIFQPAQPKALKMCLFYPSQPPPKKGGAKASKSSSSSTSRYSTASSRSTKFVRAQTPPQIHIHSQQPQLTTSALPPYLISTTTATVPTTFAYPSPTPTTDGSTNIWLAPAAAPAAPTKEKEPAAPARRRSSALVAEIEAIRRLAKRVGDAARRGSASSFRRGSGGGGRETGKEERRAVVDEEARRMALQNGEVVRGLVHERDVQIAAKKIVEGEREREWRERASANYGNGGGGGGAGYWGQDGGWRGGNGNGNGNGFGNNYAAWPGNGVNGGMGNGNGNGAGTGMNAGSPGGRGGGEAGASNHIHVHTAPLIQGPSISTTTPPMGTYSTASAFGAGMGAGVGLGAEYMGAGSGERKGSWGVPIRRLIGERLGMGMPMPMGAHGMGVVGTPEREWERERIWRTTWGGNGGFGGLGGLGGLGLGGGLY